MSQTTLRFDDGTNGSAIAQVGDVIDVSGATYTSAGAIHGPLAMLTDNTQFIRVTNSTGSSTHTGSLYVRIPDAQASGAARIVTLTNSSNGNLAVIRINNSGAVQIADAGNAAQATSSSTIATNAVGRLDWQWDDSVLGSQAAPILTVRIFTDADSESYAEQISWTASGLASAQARWVLGTLSGTATWAGHLDTFRAADGLEWLGIWTDPSYEISIDWDNDGTFVDANEDVTYRTLAPSGGGVTIQYGRDQARSLAPTQPGEAELELNNTVRDYSPENTSSPLSGQLIPGRPVRIRATFESTVYDLYSGHLDSFEVLPGPQELSRVNLGALDAVGRLQQVTISTALHHGVSTGQAIGLVLDAVGWPADKRDLDPGATWIEWWWEEGTSAAEALTRIVNSEGPPAFVSVAGDGSFLFRDRHHRMVNSASTASQATFRDTGTEPLYSAPLGYDIGWKDVINQATIDVQRRTPGIKNSEIWTYDQIFTVKGGEFVRIKAELSDPAFDIFTPTEVREDFTVSNNTMSSIQTVLSRNSGQSVIIEFFGVGTSSQSATISNLRLVGRPVQAAETLVVEAEHGHSVDEYGPRSQSIDAPWCNAQDAAAIISIILGQRAERLPTVSIRLVSGAGGNTTRMTQMLTRDLSDRVHLVNADVGLDDDVFVEQIQHTITSGGLIHETTFGVEKARDQPSNVLVLDVGQLDVNTLGWAGVNSPNVLVLGSATKGVLGTNVLGY